MGILEKKDGKLYLHFRRKRKYVNIECLHFTQKGKYINIKCLHSENIQHIETKRIELYVITLNILFYNSYKRYTLKVKQTGNTK